MTYAEDRPHDVLDDTDAILSGLIRIEAALDKVPDAEAAMMAGMTVAVARHINELCTELLAARGAKAGAAQVEADNQAAQVRLVTLMTTTTITTPGSAQPRPASQSTLF